MGDFTRPLQQPLFFEADDACGSRPNCAEQFAAELLH